MRECSPGTERPGFCIGELRSDGDSGSALREAQDGPLLKLFLVRQTCRRSDHVVRDAQLLADRLYGFAFLNDVAVGLAVVLDVQLAAGLKLLALDLRYFAHDRALE